MFCCWLKSMYLFWHSCSSFVRTPQPGEFCVRQSLGRAPTVAYLKLSMQNMNRTFTFGTLKALHNCISTVQEENTCLITLPVNKYNLFCDFCFFFLPSQCWMSVLTHHLCISQPCLFLFKSICYSLFCQAKQRRNSWYWRISVCLAVFFLFRCWTLGDWGYSNLKHFNYTSLAFGLLSFLLDNAGTNYFRGQKGN